MIPPPAVSTIHAALDRNGLVKRRKRRRYKACGTPLTAAHAPNGLWCADLQGRVHARQPAVLLPAHRHRLPLPLPARLRRPRVDASRSSPSPCSSAPSATSACRPRSAPTTARRSPRPGDVRLVPSRRLVAALRDPPAAHQARQAAAERTSRAHAPHAQERNDQARRVQLPAAAGALRGLHPGLQPGAAAPGARRPLPGRDLYTLSRALTSRPIPSTRSTIAPSASRAAAASASAIARST